MYEYYKYDFAKENGYSLYSSSPNSTSYVKNDVCLTIFSDGTASLSRILGLITCSTGVFGVPNKNFHIFEEQIENIVQLQC